MQTASLRDLIKNIDIDEFTDSDDDDQKKYRLTFERHSGDTKEIEFLKPSSGVAGGIPSEPTTDFVLEIGAFVEVQQSFDQAEAQIVFDEVFSEGKRDYHDIEGLWKQGDTLDLYVINRIFVRDYYSTQTERVTAFLPFYVNKEIHQDSKNDDYGGRSFFLKHDNWDSEETESLPGTWAVYSIAQNPGTDYRARLYSGDSEAYRTFEDGDYGGTAHLLTFDRAGGLGGNDRQDAVIGGSYRVVRIS